MTERKKHLFITSIGIFIFLGAFGAWKLIQDTAPKPSKTIKAEVARLVDVAPLQRGDSRPEWKAGATVVASDSVTLVAQVGGRIEHVESDAVPGALLSKGALLAQLEKGDYQLALQQAQATLTQAKAALAIEQGQVSLAEEEFALSGTQLSATDRALVLRDPQLQIAKADLVSAEAAVQQAELNLARTEIRMPFDGRVISRAISTGSVAGTGSELFGVVATSEFWIEAKLPRSFLALLDHSHPVLVSHAAWGDETREAKILSILPGVDSGDRQARIVLSLASPLDSTLGPVVLLNDYVSLTLSGLEFKNAYRVPREYVSDNGGVWVVNDMQLSERRPNGLYTGRDHVWFSDGFEEGDCLLISQVDAAVTGMKVRVSGDDQ